MPIVKIERRYHGISSPSPSPSPPSTTPPHLAGSMVQFLAQFPPGGRESKHGVNRYDAQAAAPSDDDTESYYVSDGEDNSTSSDDESWLSPGESSPNDDYNSNFKDRIGKIKNHQYRKPDFKTFFRVKWEGYCLTTWESLDYMCQHNDDSALKKYVRRLSEASKKTLIRRAPVLGKYLRTKKSSRKSNNSRS